MWETVLLGIPQKIKAWRLQRNCLCWGLHQGKMLITFEIVVCCKKINTSTSTVCSDSALWRNKCVFHIKMKINITEKNILSNHGDVWKLFTHQKVWRDLAFMTWGRFSMAWSYCISAGTSSHLSLYQWMLRIIGPQQMKTNHCAWVESTVKLP